MGKQLSLFFLLCCNFYALSQSWRPTAPPSYTSGYSHSIEFKANGDGYLAVRTNTNKLQVFRWDGASWSTIASNLGSFTDDIEVIPGNGDTVYVSYSTSIPNNIISVRMYDGTSWSFLGNSSITGNSYARKPSMARNPNTGELYLSYIDGTRSNKITLRKWNGTSWASYSAGYTGAAFNANKLAYDPNNNLFYTFILGNNGPSLYRTNASTISWQNIGSINTSAETNGFDLVTHPTNGVPHIVFPNRNNGNNAEVYQFLTFNNSLVHVGTVGTVSSGRADYSNLKFDNNGVIHISYGKLGASNSLTVKKYDMVSGTWVEVGPAGFRNTYYSDLAFDVNNTPFVANGVNIDTLSCNSYVTIDTSQCLTYTSPSGKVWTTSGTYMDTVPNHLACDSFVTINLTIYNEVRDTITKTVCGEFIAPSGKRLATTGIYGDTVPDGQGCDSLFYINLTVLIEDRLITPSNMASCNGNPIDITITNSQNNTVYSLYDSTTNTQIGTSLNGNGSNLVFNTGTVSTTTTFQVKALEDNSYLLDSSRIKFGGNRDRVVIPVSGSPTLQDNWTMEAWVNIPSNTGTVQPLFSFHTTVFVGTTLEVVYTPGTGEISLMKRHGATIGGTYVLSGSSYIPINQDFHLALAYRQSNRTASLYINGVLVANVWINDVNFLQPLGGRLLVLGDVVHSAYNGISSFNGSIDEFRFWQKEKTATQILAENMMCLQGNEPQLKIYLNLEEGNDTIIYNKVNGGQGYIENSSSLTVWEDGIFSCPLPTPCEKIMTNIKILAGGNTSYATLNEKICSGTYTSPSGKSWNTAGTYMDTIPNMSGCDSVLTINLTVGSNTTATLNDTICSGNSYTSPSGKTWNTPGTYMDTISNQSGCDSVITINLDVTVIQVVPLSISNACGTGGQTPITITVNNTQNGIVYLLRDSTTGGAIGGVPGIIGDGTTKSFIVFPLNVSSPITLEVFGNKGTCYTSMGFVTAQPKFQTYNQQNIQVCSGSFTSPISNKTWTTSGTYYDTLMGGNQYGCDSIFVFNLTVGSQTTSTITEIACDEYQTPSGKYVYSSGTILDTITNASGCDSVITINLIVNMSTSNSVNMTVCDSYTGPSGKIYTTTGSHKDTITNAAGCDSVTTINLTVTPQNYSISQVADTLIASFTTGSALQWLNCDNGYAVIPGATGYKFNPTSTGNYALEMRWLNCIDTSACYNISYTNIEENNTPTLSVYPNPTNNILYINGINLNQTTIKIVDISGKEIKVTKTNNSIHTQHLVRGTYVLIILTDKGVKQTKFTKQ